MQRTMNPTVREIQEVVAAECIDCDFEAGGYLSVARNPDQWRTARQIGAELPRHYPPVGRILVEEVTSCCSPVRRRPLSRGLRST